MNEEKSQAEKRAPEPADGKNAASSEPRTKEIGGRKGPDPVRYGDWENNGIASDF